MLYSIFIMTALASPVTVKVQTDGSVTASLKVPATQQAVRTFLANPYSYTKLDPSVTVTVQGKDGACTLLKYASAARTYQVNMCETPKGFQLDLVSSKTIKFYQATWEISPVDQSTQINYRIMVKPKFYIPQFILSRKLQYDIDVFFTAFHQHFANHYK